MTISRLKVVLAASVALAALAGCGSSSDDNSGSGTGTAPTPTPTTDVPLTAQSSVDSLVAYLRALIANNTNETGSPILVGDAVLLTSETAEPTP